MQCILESNVVSELRTESRSVSQFAGKRIHFIGIGGSGMSGLAGMLLDAGAIVSGSEPNRNAQTFELIRRGAQISPEQNGTLLSKQTDIVVRSAAIKDSNLEFHAAGAYGIRTMKYAEMLGAVMKERRGIAVAGTHGKSTTSAMISHALTQCGADPSFVIGGTVPQLGGGSHSGKSDLFVAEACEFDRSFLKLYPKVAIVTNIEEDHLDYYKDLKDIISAFRDFIRLVPTDGVIIAGVDGNVREAASGSAARVESCGLESSQKLDWMVRPTGIKNGCPTGEVFFNGKSLASLQLSIAGEHNLINATMALAACNAVGIDLTEAAAALGTFRGVDRRMSEVGRCNGAIVVDDYGHHPTEIRATLKALQEKYQPKRLLCVFQPHQHSRTRFLLNDFAASFSDATEAIVPDIYFVRDSENERSQVSAADLVSRIQANGHRAQHLAEFSQIVNYLRKELREGDVIVTMGAGNVWEIGRELVG